MRYYTKTEVMQDLRINHHRLRKLLEVCGIIPKGSQFDGRYRLISESEYTSIKEQLTIDREALGLSPEGLGDQSALIARIAELEAQNRSLARRIADSGIVIAPSAVAANYTAVGALRYDDTGMLSKGSVARLIAAHSTYSMDTARKHHAGQMGDAARRSVDGVLGWLKAYLHHVNRDADWHECDDGECGCHGG